MPCPETVRDIKRSRCIALKLHFSIRSHHTPLQWGIITDLKKKNQVIYSGYYRLTRNRHHPMGSKGSKGNYSLAGQDLFEGFKVCGSLLSNRAARATPAHTPACRKAKGDFWDSGCLGDFDTWIKPNQIIVRKLRTCRHSFCHSCPGVHPEARAFSLIGERSMEEENVTPLSLLPQ